LLGLALALVAPCSGCSDESVVVDESVRAGRQVYERLDCQSCHGFRREGKRTAPPLTGLVQYWSEEDMIRYLEDPAPVVEATPRLAYRLEQYPIAMPGYADKASEEELQELARYMLTD
jgi:mono/diheme cytochrome c family protein